MDLTRVSTVPLARLASRSQSRNTCPFWKPQTDASGSSRAWCHLRSRPEGRCGGVGGENPPSRRPQRRAHFPERHRLVPGGASAPSARTAVGTGAGGPHAQAGQAARGGLAGRGPSSLAPCALPRLPALPAGGGAGRVPVRRADPAQDLARPPAPGGEGPRSPESEDREEGADSLLPRNDGRDAAPEPVPLRTGGSRPAAGRALGRRCVAAPLLLTR